MSDADDDVLPLRIDQTLPDPRVWEPALPETFVVGSRPITPERVEEIAAGVLLSAKKRWTGLKTRGAATVVLEEMVAALKEEIQSHAGVRP